MWIIGRGGAGIEDTMALLPSEIDEVSILGAIDTEKRFRFEGFARV